MVGKKDDFKPIRAKWPQSASQSVVTPLMPSVVYSTEGPDALDAQYEGLVNGYVYAREGHPNADVLASRIDALEGAESGLITGSGMAAVAAALFGLLRSGDHALGGSQLYGQSMRLMSKTLPRFGIETTLSDATDAKRFAKGLRANTRMILLETVSNPTLRVSDMKGIAEIARARGIPLLVDNTFTTPRGFRPLEHGADLVIHSVTKLLSGHSDVTLGYIACRDAKYRETIRETSVTLGFASSPFDCWLAERGLLSFELRYDRAETNARKLADALAETKGILRVLYPLRTDHPDHGRAKSLFADRGGNMVSFEIDGGRAAANRLVRSLSEIPFAPTLGDISTTLSHPATSSHRSLESDTLEQLGISEGFFRVSVGIEEPDALVRRFSEAVGAASY